MWRLRLKLPIFLFFLGEFAGEYKPLAEFLDSKRGSLNLPSHPMSPVITCSGRARDWPESRGVFCNKDCTFFVFVNQDDHLQFRCFDIGGNLQAVFDKLVRGLAAFERELKKSGEEFIWDDHLGYIVSDPIHLGTALEVRVRVKLHHLSTVSQMQRLLTSHILFKQELYFRSVGVASWFTKKILTYYVSSFKSPIEGFKTSMDTKSLQIRKEEDW